MLETGRNAPLSLLSEPNLVAPFDSRFCANGRLMVCVKMPEDVVSNDENSRMEESGRSRQESFFTIRVASSRRRRGRVKFLPLCSVDVGSKET